MDLAVENEFSMDWDQVKDETVPFNASVRGKRRPAAPLMKRL
jgi:hypothetical protein